MIRQAMVMSTIACGKPQAPGPCSTCSALQRSSAARHCLGTDTCAVCAALRPVQLAVIFETLGSMILGRTITGTIQGGIADINAFTREPQVGAGCWGRPCLSQQGPSQLCGMMRL